MNGYAKHFFCYISLVVVLIGCSREDEIKFLSSPALSVASGFPAQPIVSVEYMANKDSKAEFLSDDVSLAAFTRLQPAKQNRQLMLVGLGFPVDDLRLRLTSKSGASILSGRLVLPVDASELAPFKVTKADNAAKYGPKGRYSVVSIYRETAGGVESFVLAFNQSGQLSWMLPVDTIVTGLAQTSDDTLVLSSKNGIRRVNSLGQPLSDVAGSRQILADTNISTRVPAAYIIAPLADYKGTAVLLAEPEWQQIEVGSNKTKNLIGANILSVSESGNIEKRWSLFDLLDTRRAGQVSEVAVPEYFSEERAEKWAELTALKYAPDRNEIIAEVAGQKIVMGVDVADPSLNWLLGDSKAWGKQWQSLFLKTAENGSDILNPKLHGVYRNADVLLGNALTSKLGRYRINIEKKVLEPVVVYSAIDTGVSVNSESDLTFVTLVDDQLLVVDKEAATISVIDAESNFSLWLSIEPLFDQSPWRISAVESNIELRAPSQVAPNVVVNEHASNLTVSVTQDAPLIGADPRGQPVDMTGQWQVMIDGETIPRAHELVLLQNGYSASGTFVEQPIQALIKGNVISFTLRGRSNGARALQRFRAVINESEDTLKGQVDILIDGQLVAKPVWQASRITTNSP